ncbi:MAG: serine hydrolase, partial [Chlamydiota bacterium]
MIKQFLFFFLLSMTFLEGKTTFKARSEIALLINADTGAVLYEKNGSLLCHPASTTKLATALYAAHLQTDWEEIIEVPSEAIGSISYEAKKRANYKKPAYWVEVGSTHVGLKKGEKLSFHNLMAATIVASANDAANVIAYHTGKGDIDLFVKGLNKYLKEELGCKKTTFYNPHGLFIPDHQTTAKDMALITRAFLKDKRLKNLGSLSTFPVDETNKQEALLLVNKNKLLRKGEHYYP